MISPSDAKRIKRRGEGELEARIDEAIETAAEYGDATVTIGVGGYSSNVVDSIVAKYKMSGWDCERVNDSRDGDFIKVVMP